MDALAEVRRQIDHIDQQLLALLVQRQHWVVQAGLSPAVAKAVWRAMMAAFIALETDINQDKATE
ncbi:chorismate mutase family protein [Paralysiella testudinis]|uniref:Chorismate mutase n=1 Tax=Paralysiella testudinis TaxID=2809020 RepID=A0A892ZHX3_9NEIS|nr:chorismate mutase [Paralysiella testudinis]QRQ82038.1 chorismate mutase [Paralysiella testudinis]